MASHLIHSLRPAIQSRGSGIIPPACQNNSVPPSHSPGNEAEPFTQPHVTPHHPHFKAPLSPPANPVSRWSFSLRSALLGHHMGTESSEPPFLASPHLLAIYFYIIQSQGRDPELMLQNFSSTVILQPTLCSQTHCFSQLWLQWRRP